MPTPPVGQLRGDVRIINRDRTTWGTPARPFLTLITQLVRQVAIAAAQPAVFQLNGQVPIVLAGGRPTTVFLTGMNQLIRVIAQASGNPPVTQLRDVPIVATETGAPTESFTTDLNLIIAAVAAL